MSSGIPSLTILSEEQKFNGENLLQWKTNITQLLGSKGLLGYIDGTIEKPTQPTTPEKEPTTGTEIYSTHPTFDEWVFRDQLARDHITLNCVDVASLGVATTGTAKDAWDSIQAEWGKSTNMRRSHAQEALNRTEYIEGTGIQDHIKLLHTQKVALNNLCTEMMSDEMWRGVIIRSIPPTSKWLPFIPALYQLPTSADIISTLLAHGMVLERGNPKTTTSAGSSNTDLTAQVKEGCTNPNCKARKRSTHTTDDCYWPGGGKEGQFPPNFGQKAKANIATSTSTPATSAPPSSTSAISALSQTEHFVLSAQVSGIPGRSRVLINSEPIKITDFPPTATALISQGFQGFQDGKVPTFMDSGASNMIFVSKDAFDEYKSTPLRIGDSAKALDGNFKIIGEGNVTQ